MWNRYRPQICLPGVHSEAKQFLENALKNSKEIGDRQKEGASNSSLGNLFHSLGEYRKAKEFYENALAISKEIGDRQGEGESSSNLGKVFHSLGEYDKAKEYQKNALAISKEIGDRQGEVAYNNNLGHVFCSLREYGEAKGYYENALAIKKEISTRHEEIEYHNTMGHLCCCMDALGEAKRLFEKAHAISKETGYRQGEVEYNNNLGHMFCFLGEHGKAKRYHENALAISKEIGDRPGEVTYHNNPGNVFYTIGEYGKAKGYYENALAIKKEIGDRQGEVEYNNNLGHVFCSLGEYGEAKGYYENALTISKEIGDRRGEGESNSNLGKVFHSLGEYDKAKECHENALAISKEIGDRQSKYKAKEYYTLAYSKESDDQRGEGTSGEKYYNKFLVISTEMRHRIEEIRLETNLAMIMLSEGNILEGVPKVIESVNRCENIRRMMLDNDEFKMSLMDQNVLPYQTLSELLSVAGEFSLALHTKELGRARALGDLMSNQYNVENPVAFDHQSHFDFKKFIKDEMSCLCLYVSFTDARIFFWILKANKPMVFRAIETKDCFPDDGPTPKLDTFLAKDITLRRFHVLPKGQCEDRSLFSVNDNGLAQKSSQENSPADFRLVEEDTEEDGEPEPSLSLIHKLIIAPVADFLDEPEIVIVPDRSLYSVPFAALRDESGVYLSDQFRIRFVPSLTTLKLIQDCPADYHSQTGALIVGDPKVGRVNYKGHVQQMNPLYFARKEAEMVGSLLGVQPLLGEHATKQAVLQSMDSASLIHFAAHGNAERGEIVLAPQQPIHKESFPLEEEYLLTMSDISKVRLRTKLVVLSCCHSGKGQIRSEGVVGIARAFLSSGARSVLAALWAIPDCATERLMSCFYEHLVRGESASESLHQAMKWMRSNGYSEVKDWAPFMLIGDDVTFDFANQKELDRKRESFYKDIYAMHQAWCQWER